MKKEEKTKKKSYNNQFFTKINVFSSIHWIFCTEIDVFVAFLIFYGSIDMSICPA